MIRFSVSFFNLLNRHPASPDLLSLFDPLSEGRGGDALPVAADERKETLGINSIEKIWQTDHDHDYDSWMAESSQNLSLKLKTS